MSRILLLVIVVSCLAFADINATQIDNKPALSDSVKTDTLGTMIITTSPAEKSAGTAFALAIFPGVLVHGLGHAYLGDRQTFGKLFMTELVCIPIAVMTSRASNGSSGLPAFAGVIFGTTWLIDVIGAPIKAHKLNSNKISKITFGPKKIKNTLGYALNIGLGQ